MRKQTLAHDGRSVLFLLAGVALGYVGSLFIRQLTNHRIRQNKQDSPKDNSNFKGHVLLQKTQKSSNKKYLIVADGPFLPKDIISEVAADKIIIALEGAANQLAKRGIMPDVILGDFDSIENSNWWGITNTFDDIDEKSEPYIGRHGIIIVPAKNQEFTDFQKAIQYCDQQKAETIDIVCATGGRMDHTLSNIRTLRMAYKSERIIYLHTESQTLQFATTGEYVMRGRKGDYCGILAFPEAKFSSKGLAYNGDSYPLKFGISESTSNLLNQDSAEITIEGEALLIMPGILQAQRDYNRKSQLEKMHCLFSESQRAVISTKVSLLEKIFGKHNLKITVSELFKDSALPSDDEEVLISIPEQSTQSFTRA